MSTFISRVTEGIQKHFSSLNSPVDPDSRFELKYRLTFFQYLKVRNAISSYMVMDSYTRREPRKRYLVRSLYFDTDDYQAYEQKMSGDCDRVKFRLRTYVSDYLETTPIRVELKIREGDRMVKKSTFVSNEEYSSFMGRRHWENFQNPVTIEFERQVLIRGLSPVILVEYEREGYRSRLKNDLRITFDHCVRSVHAKTLFPNQPFFRLLMPKNVILEIKFRESLPIWLGALVREQGLKVIANSKYTQCLQVARHDLYHPEKVILVR